MGFDDKPARKEVVRERMPTILERLAVFEQGMANLIEQLEEANAKIRRLTRQVGEEEPR